MRGDLLDVTEQRTHIASCARKLSQARTFGKSYVTTKPLYPYDVYIWTLIVDLHISCKIWIQQEICSRANRLKISANRDMAPKVMACGLLDLGLWVHPWKPDLVSTSHAVSMRLYVAFSWKRRPSSSCFHDRNPKWSQTSCSPNKACSKAMGRPPHTLEVKSIASFGNEFTCADHGLSLKLYLHKHGMLVGTWDLPRQNPSILVEFWSIKGEGCAIHKEEAVR